jgi:hypothetical protein
MTATTFRGGTENVFNDPASSTNYGQVFPKGAQSVER